jgi:hypothetical protein
MNGSNNIRCGPAMPDMKWINTEIPILEVARKLGLVVRGKKATCPECEKRRLTFSLKLNLWRCWNCSPAGKGKSVLDLVMFMLNVEVYDAAKWISEQWNVIGKVQVERSENRCGRTKHVYRHIRQIPGPEKDKPTLVAIIASPGWREMNLSARVVAMALLPLAQLDSNQTVTISRRELGDLTGVRNPHALAKANGELEAIGPFTIDRGWGNQAGHQITTYRLTSWSDTFQKWLLSGFLAGLETSTPTPPPPSLPRGTCTSRRPDCWSGSAGKPAPSRSCATCSRTSWRRGCCRAVALEPTRYGCGWRWSRTTS